MKLLCKITELSSHYQIQISIYIYINTKKRKSINIVLQIQCTKAARSCFFIMQEKSLTFLYDIQSMITVYSQTCVKRSPLGQDKSGVLRHVSS